MESEDAEAFRAELDALIGRPPGGSGFSEGPDPVNQPMIRHWAASFEDANPVYTDPEAAARRLRRHGLRVLEAWADRWNAANFQTATPDERPRCRADVSPATRRRWDRT